MDPKENTRNIDRRRLLLTGAIVGSSAVAGAAAIHDGPGGAPSQTIKGTMPWSEGTADAPPADGGTDFRFFNTAEQAFVMSAIDRLIPPDPTGPSGTQANVHIFLDHQLAGPYGRGDHFYLGGPWPKGVPEQGYQSRMTPAQLYRSSIAAIESTVRDTHRGKSFSQLDHAAQDAVLKGLESGSLSLGSADDKAFFGMFLQNVLEGYFSDPIYGGNKDMAAWKMIGFPGAHYDYREWVSRHGQRVPFPQVSIAGRPGWSEG